MSQHLENDSDDDDCEYFLQPVSNQYNITEKIKEANQQLYKGEHLQRSSQPKVRFRDHQLVDFEPEGEEDGTEIMERRSSNNSGNNNNISKQRGEESSDDGYIDEDETLEASGDERLIIEAIEIEEVSEQIEILGVTTSDNITEPSEAMSDEHNYEDDEFDEEGGAYAAASTTGAAQRKATASGKGAKKIFRSRINPIDGEAGHHIRQTTKKKDCCQYKETDEYKNKLPRYNGFYSHYGLSKDEYVRRESKQLENNQLQFRRRSRRIEQKEFLAKTNEDAFAKWLYKKMRTAVSKSNPANMYDVKPSALMRKQSKREQKRQRQTIQRQMETDEYDDDDDDDDDVSESDDGNSDAVEQEVVGEEEQEEELQDNDE